MAATTVIAVGATLDTSAPGGVQRRDYRHCGAAGVGVGVAILNYRLYDIDRVSSRTLAYAIPTRLLVGVYAAVVLLATKVLRVHTPVAMAASTRAAALFCPLRPRVKRAPGRRHPPLRWPDHHTCRIGLARPPCLEPSYRERPSASIGRTGAERGAPWSSRATYGLGLT